MKYAIYIVAFVIGSVFVTNTVFAQQGGVSINPIGTAADSSAMLDVSSTTKGLLPPRMTTAQRNSISGPATGLVVYQTDGTAGLYCNNGTPASPNWQLLGPTASLAYGYFYSSTSSTLGTSYQDLNFNNTGASNNITYNSTNSTATIAVTGIYKISYTMECVLNTAQISAQIMVNGTRSGYAETVASSNSNLVMLISGESIVSLTPGDLIEIQGVNITGAGSTVLVLNRYLDITQIQ